MIYFNKNFFKLIGYPYLTEKENKQMKKEINNAIIKSNYNIDFNFYISDCYKNYLRKLKNNKKADIKQLVIIFNFIFYNRLSTHFCLNIHLGLKHFAELIAYYYLFEWNNKANIFFSIVNDKIIEKAVIDNYNLYGNEYQYSVNCLSWFIFKLYYLTEYKLIGKNIPKNIIDLEYIDLLELNEVYENWNTKDINEVIRHIEIMAIFREKYLDPDESLEEEFMFAPLEILFYLKVRKKHGLVIPKQKEIPYSLFDYYDIDEFLNKQDNIPNNVYELYDYLDERYYIYIDYMKSLLAPFHLDIN